MKSLKQLRRDAKSLKAAFEDGDLHAKQRVANHPPRADGIALKHADYLHVIAREQSFSSWPLLKVAVELDGLDLAAQRQRLRIAIVHGQSHVVDRLLDGNGEIAVGHLDLEIGLYRKHAVFKTLQDDPSAAQRDIGGRAPICHLAFSKYIHQRPDLEGDMIAIADRLLALGANTNSSVPVAPDNPHQLSALYGTIGHSNNMPLARWFLKNGADPDDGESLYHSTELGHHEALEMLLAHGANPAGTNALLRAMDFADHRAVELLIKAGAKTDEFNGTHVGGETPWVVPALHQAARRMSDARMIDLLLKSGTDPSQRFEGSTAYAYARVFGNRGLASALEAVSLDTGLVDLDLTISEKVLAGVAEAIDIGSARVDRNNLPKAYQNIIRVILHLPGKLPHVKRLVAAGLDFDQPDAEGLTPVQVAGWEGLAEVMEYLLSLGPDLSHQNGYGGSLLSTILHGSENAPRNDRQDYLACLQMALQAGVAVPKRAPDLAGVPELSDLLAEWCETHPQQVVDGGSV